MEVFESDETILVRNATGESHEFAREGETDAGDEILRPKQENPPRIVVDGLESRGFTVTEDSSDEFDLHLDCGYSSRGAARELGFDQDNDRFEDLLGLVKYGVDIRVEVADDGSTWITHVAGTKLETSIRVG